MSSSTSATIKKLPTPPTELTLHSSETSARSSTIEKAGLYRSREVKKTLRDLQLVLSSINAISKVDGYTSYEDQSKFQKENDVQYLGHFLNEIWFVPNKTTQDQIFHAISFLKSDQTSPESVRLALFELWLCTKHQKINDGDMNAMIKIYSKNLAEYPENLCLVTINEMISTCEFWPSWAELQKKLDVTGSATNGMMRQLHRLHAYRQQVAELNESYEQGEAMQKKETLLGSS